MKKSEMKEIIKKAIYPHLICRTYFKYDFTYRYYFPLKVSEKLFLGAEEDDFLLDGYSIRRFQDLTRVEIKDDKCLEIATKEGLLDELFVPNVDISDWKTVFTSLQTIGKNIIVENESIYADECELVIGRITKVLSDKVRIREFDADGIWRDEWDIPFSQITSVTFGSRYVETFSKYLPPL